MNKYLRLIYDKEDDRIVIGTHEGPSSWPMFRCEDEVYDRLLSYGFEVEDALPKTDTKPISNYELTSMFNKEKYEARKMRDKQLRRSDEENEDDDDYDE